MYTGYLLSESSRNKLLELYPPKYERVVAHHITHMFPATIDDIPPMPSSIHIIGHIDSGDGVEGFLVEIDDNVIRQDGIFRYHLTYSLANNRKSVETNKYVNDNVKLINPIKITVTPKLFY